MVIFFSSAQGLLCLLPFAQDGIQFFPQLFQNGVFHFEDIAVSLLADAGNPLIGILPDGTIVQYFFMNIF